MARIETWFEQDLQKPITVRYLGGNVFSQDNMGNLIGVVLTNNGEDYSGGGTVSGNVIRNDGGTVALTGTIEGNRAYVILPQAAYAVVGTVTIIIKLTVGSETATIAAVVSDVYASSTDVVIDPGTIIPNIQTLISQIEAAVDSVPLDWAGLNRDFKSVTESTRNLFDPENAIAGAPDVTFANGEYQGTVTAFGSFVLLPHGSFQTGKTYTISFDAYESGTGSRNRLAVFQKNSTEGNVTFSTLDDTGSTWHHYSFTYTFDSAVYYVRFGRTNTSTNTWHIRDIQIEEGATETEHIQHLTAVDIDARDGVDAFMNSLKSENDLEYGLALDVYGTKTTQTQNGVTFTWNDTKKAYEVTGTAQYNAHYNIWANSSILPPVFASGRGTFFVKASNPNIIGQVYYYESGTLSEDYDDLKNGLTTVTMRQNTTGVLIRIRAKAGFTFNDTIAINCLYDDGRYLPSFGVSLIDVTDVIESMLETYGICRLGKGVYGVSGIDMPAGSVLCGCGWATELRLTGSADGYAVKMEDYCTVRDLKISGAVSDASVTVSAQVGGRHGILWAGDFDTSGSRDAQPAFGTISNCIIQRFTGGGITCDNTGPGTWNCLNVSNCFIRYCSAGINIAYYSEFHRFTNVCAHWCYYGCVNNGGNNSFVNCGFSRNIVGLITKMVDGSGRTMENNTHGSAIGCIFNHLDRDDTTLGKGKAVHIEDGGAGFVISGGQIFYGSIYIKDSRAVAFRDMNFGPMRDSNGTEIGLQIVVETTNGTTSRKQFFSNCVFSRQPEITYINTSGSGEIIWNGCYTRAGTPVPNN